MFIGFMALIALTKYKNGCNNNLTIPQIKDNNINWDNSGKMVARKKAKTYTDDNSDIATASVYLPFITWGFVVETWVQLIAVAQFKSQNIREDFKQNVFQLSSKEGILLRERSQ